jgi:flagellar motor protein MotB
MPYHRRRHSSETNIWIGYTDLLSNSLLILLLAIVVAALARANNEKPPLLRLTEQELFRFPTGGYGLSPAFRRALDKRLPEIRKTIIKYRIDSVEVIGHTDGQPSPGNSNLDSLLPLTKSSYKVSNFQSGSNTDLGLLRALEVAKYIRQKLNKQDGGELLVRPYSAASLINLKGYYDPADTKPRADRRRIELRFTRQGDR